MRYRKKRILLKEKHIKIIGIIGAVIIVILVVLFISAANKEKAQMQASVDDMAALGVINVGLRGDIGSLCTYNEETGEYEGLEKDVADEIISRIFGDDILVHYVDVNSETKNALLLSGDVDIALGASLNTGTSDICYTSSYYSDGSAFLVIEGEMTSEDGLNGGTIGVVQGSLADTEQSNGQTNLESYLEAHDINASIKEYSSYPEAIEALRDGFVNGVCANEVFLKVFGKTGMLILPERFMPNNYCVEIRESLGAFCGVVSNTIKDMQADGTMESLIDKWNLVNYASLEE